MSKILVLGLGNILLQDEGIGVRVAEYLQAHYTFPPHVRVLDGGVLGLDLLPYVEKAERLVVIDAVRSDKEPGTLIRLEGDEVPAFLSVKISPHQEGLADLLAVAHLLDCYPTEVVLWGAVPASVGVGLELSPTLQAQVEPLARLVLEELRRWGVEANTKGTKEHEGHERTRRTRA